MLNRVGSVPGTPLGAYGLRLRGVEAARLLVPVRTAWPELHVSYEVQPPDPSGEHVGEDSAVLRLRSGGRVEVERSGRSASARFIVPKPLGDEEVVHPYLAPAAAVLARWHGRETFHAGAVAFGNAVWGVIGDRFAGKSSTLARLALEGYPVVADDLLVVDRTTGEVFAGPRSVDLREDAAIRLGAGDGLGVVGARERWRLLLDPTPDNLRLAGWVHLQWADRPELVELGAAERIVLLTGQLGLRLPPRDPGVFLELASLPCFALRRPKEWSALDASLELLLDAAGR